MVGKLPGYFILKVGDWDILRFVPKVINWNILRRWAFTSPHAPITEKGIRLDLDHIPRP